MQRQGWEEQQWMLTRTEGMQTQAYVNEAQMNYSFLALFNSPPPMYPGGPVYIPSLGSEGLIQIISRHMEGQSSSYL